jgi:threonine/homoserine/homoserine lactone efflux protein
MRHSPRCGANYETISEMMIKEVALSFLVAAVASFTGSLQPGPVNLLVLGVASGKRYGKALSAAAGGSLPEVLFVFAALHCSSFIEARGQLLHLLSAIVSTVFIAGGLWLIFSKPRQPIYESMAHRNGFVTGFILACSNPQLILFWVAVLTLFRSHWYALSSAGVQYGFMAGAAVGAFSLHCLLVVITKYYAESIFFSLYRIYVNKVTGVFLLLAGSAGVLMLL